MKRFASTVVINRTPLYDWHIKNAGKMVEYAGWELPVKYEELGITQSHIHTRQQASIFDVSHMLQLEISGNDRVDFLESLLVSDLQALPESKSVLSLLTNNQGGIIDDTVVTNQGDTIGMVVNAGCALKDLTYLRINESEWKSRGKDINVRQIDRALIALQGPMSAHIMRIFCDKQTSINDIGFMTQFTTHISGIPSTVTRCGYTGEDGFEISVDNEYAIVVANELTSFVQCKPAGLAVRDTLRLEAGMCLYDNDIDDTTTPIEAGLAWTIPTSRRDMLRSIKFPGWEIIMDQLNNKSWKRKRVGVSTQFRRAPRKGSIILNSNDEPVGKVTSSVISPTLNQGIGMAYIDRPYHLLNTEGLHIDINKKCIPLTLTKMPFVKNNYYNKD